MVLLSRMSAGMSACAGRVLVSGHVLWEGMEATVLLSLSSSLLVCVDAHRSRRACHIRVGAW
jgi:hypothetical protein